MTDSNKAVFLSYAKQDADAAARICEALRTAGVEVWFDQSELRGADAWDAAIRRQIKTCALMIPIISANTQGRAEGYFRLEWKLAIDRSHLMSHDRPFLVPVVIDDTSEGGARGFCDHAAGRQHHHDHEEMDSPIRRPRGLRTSV